MKKLWFAIGCAAALGIFLCGVDRLAQGNSAEQKARLEAALRESAVACYAAEGSYPPSVAYLEEHYGLQIDRERYEIGYQVIAENLMPDITVLEKQP